MAEHRTPPEFPDAARLQQMAAKMRAAETQGLSEAEIRDREQRKERRRKENVAVLEDTLEILDKGGYTTDGRDIRLQFTPEQLREVQVFLPEDLDSLRQQAAESSPEREDAQSSRCVFGCENTDTLVLARNVYLQGKQAGETAPGVLVLNLASATRPGGQTRKGASAQEEDLCRRTSLLLSLESEPARAYYAYNQERKSLLGSDAILLSPYVEVLKDASARTLEDPFPISVLSCAAPMVRLGLEGLSQKEYETMLYHRIEGMFLVAASQHYRHLVLGAFGCGVYGNDAATVSEQFDRVIRNFTYAGQSSRQLFDSIHFAVLCRPGKEYNYKEFCRRFAPVSREESGV